MASQVVNVVRTGHTRSTLWDTCCCNAPPTKLSLALTSLCAAAGIAGIVFEYWALGAIFLALALLGGAPMLCCKESESEERMATLAVETATGLQVPLTRQSSLIGRLLLNRMNSASRKVDPKGEEEGDDV